MVDSPLRASDWATVDASGRATVTLQPLRAFERWHITRITVQSTSSTLIPTCRVYKGGESAGGLVDGTFTGTMDSTETSLDLQSGEILLVVWEGIDVGTPGADVGSVCTVSVEGKTRHGV